MGWPCALRSRFAESKLDKTLALLQHYEVLQVIDDARNPLFEFKILTVPMFPHIFLGKISDAIVLVDSNEIAPQVPKLLYSLHVIRLYSIKVTFVDEAFFFKRCDSIRNKLAG